MDVCIISAFYSDPACGPATPAREDPADGPVATPLVADPTLTREQP